MRQYVNPEVSKQKFTREIADFKASAKRNRERGWLLVEEDYPVATVVMAVPKLKPPALAVGVRFDFTNYDADPPSVTLVHPLTDEPYAMKDIPIQVVQVLPGPPPTQQLQSLMQSYSPDAVPFLCVPGVREYHDNPAHTGDPWELHRPQGAGRLVRLLDIIFVNGILRIKGVQINLLPQVVGFRTEFSA